ncbi:hypothetical protein ABD70_17790 [Alkalihalobacillus lehensis]|nr:hypothetical protein [Shouchella lehensis]
MERYNKERKELLEEHAEKDERGEAIIENENYRIKDYQALQEDLLEFEKEMPLAIEGTAYQGTLETLQTIFVDLEEKEFGGVESEIYDYLYDQLEKGDEE